MILLILQDFTAGSISYFVCLNLSRFFPISYRFFGPLRVRDRKILLYYPCNLSFVEEIFIRIFAALVFITKCVNFYYKVRQLFVLQSALIFITKCVRPFITKCVKVYYKVRQVLQSVELLQSALVQRVHFP